MAKKFIKFEGNIEDVTDDSMLIVMNEVHNDNRPVTDDVFQTEVPFSKLSRVEHKFISEFKNMVGAYVHFWIREYNDPEKESHITIRFPKYVWKDKDTERAKKLYKELFHFLGEG